MTTKRIDVEKQLTKQKNIMDALSDKSLRPQDWVEELASQVYALNLVCLQQQEEIDELRK